MPRLDSSAISKVTYNKKTQKMNVRFVGTGKSYTYVGVPKQVYQDFIDAPSAGQFFNDYIKDDYIATPSEFVDSVRFNEQMMKLGAMTLSEQEFDDSNLVDFGDGASIDGRYLASLASKAKRPIEYYRSGDRIYRDPPAYRNTKRTVQGLNYFGVGDGPDPNNPDPALGVYAPSKRVGKNPLDRLKPTRTVPVSYPIPKPRPISESPIAMTAAGIRGLINLVKKAGPAKPYPPEYYRPKTPVDLTPYKGAPKYMYPPEVFRNKGQK